MNIKKISIVILKYFQWLKKVKMKKPIFFYGGKYRKFKNPKKSYIFEKTLVLCIICSKCQNEDVKRFKEGESGEKLDIHDLIKNT